MKSFKVNYKTNLSIIIKRLLRKAVSANSNCPIKIINGNYPPKLVGSSWHYENKSGEVINHPNAYRKAWGKPIYIPSTKRVEVGDYWLFNNLSLFEIQKQSLKAFE